MPTRLSFHLPLNPMRHSFQGSGELFEFVFPNLQKKEITHCRV